MFSTLRACNLFHFNLMVVDRMLEPLDEHFRLRPPITWLSNPNIQWCRHKFMSEPSHHEPHKYKLGAQGHSKSFSLRFEQSHVLSNGHQGFPRLYGIWWIWRTKSREQQLCANHPPPQRLGMRPQSTLPSIL